MNAIVTGSTGMVGEGVLHECLLDPTVKKVLAVNRKPCGVSHPKLQEIIHPNFFDFASIENQLKGYDACFFCAGVSSMGKSEQEYSRLTYDLTLSFAQTLARLNPQMTFCYISGEGTDSSEKGRIMWARVKGKTENALMRLPFKKAVMFRPGYMQPTPGLKRTLKYYAAISWMYPFLRWAFPASVSTLQELALAMIHSVRSEKDRAILEVKDIVRLAAKNEA